MTKHDNMAKLNISIETTGEDDKSLELLAESIIEIAEAFKKLEKSKLKERTILLLLNDATGIPMRDIQAILRTVPQLETLYLKSNNKIVKTK